MSRPINLRCHHCINPATDHITKKKELRSLQQCVNCHEWSRQLFTIRIGCHQCRESKASGHKHCPRCGRQVNTEYSGQGHCSTCLDRHTWNQYVFLSDQRHCPRCGEPNSGWFTGHCPPLNIESVEGIGSWKR